MRTQSNSTVLLALAVGLGLAGCKKEPTTDPGSATPATSEDDDGAGSDDGSDDGSDEPSDEGEAPLGKANFDETVFEHFSEVSDCYVAALEGNPELAGKLEADFTIGADGSLVELIAVESSTIWDDAMLDCIRDAAKGWEFAKPADGDMTLRYTFNLQPG